MIDPDPPRLMESAREAELRLALKAASARVPTQAQLEVLAGKVASASVVGVGVKVAALWKIAGAVVGAIGAAALVWVSSSSSITPTSTSTPTSATTSTITSMPSSGPTSPSTPALDRRAEVAARAEAAAARSMEKTATRKRTPTPMSTSTSTSTSPRTATPKSGPSAVLPEPETAKEGAPEKVEAPSELALLGQVQGMLARDPEGALDLLEEHRDAYPRGAFAEEREALAIDALRRLGRRGDLEARARAFLARYPKSPHRDRIQAFLD